jgi:hypothetical protein
MIKNNQILRNKHQQPSKGPVVQQFAASGSAVSTPELPYDVEKARGSNIKPNSKAQNG